MSARLGVAHPSRGRYRRGGAPRYGGGKGVAIPLRAGRASDDRLFGRSDRVLSRDEMILAIPDNFSPAAVETWRPGLACARGRDGAWKVRRDRHASIHAAFR